MSIQVATTVVPRLPGPHTPTTTLAVSELRGVGFTDADVSGLLGDPDRVGPRGGRRYDRARAALAVARHRRLLNSYAGRHGWWASLRHLAEGWAVPVPYTETVIVPHPAVSPGQRLEVHGSAPVVVFEPLCTYEGLTLVRAELAPAPVPPAQRLALLHRPDTTLLAGDHHALASQCAAYAAALLVIAPDLHADAEVAAAAEHSRVHSEIAAALDRPQHPGVAEALALIQDVPPAETGSMARAVRALALAHAARRA